MHIEIRDGSYLRHSDFGATEQSVQDAIHSRETLLTYQKQKGVIQ